MKIVKEEVIDGFRVVLYEKSPGHYVQGKYKVVKKKSKK